jgi:hypothetical protein
LGLGEFHKVLITGGHHANEWAGVEMAYLLAEYLVTTFDQNAGDPKDPSNPTKEELLQLSIRHILTNRQIIIVPMVNPDGHNFSVRRNREWRKNRFPLGNGFQLTEFGVDINRNYPGNFGKVSGGSSPDPKSDQFRGLVAASEIETQAMVQIIKDNQDTLKAVLDYHSSSQEILALGDDETDATVQSKFVKFAMLVLLRERPGVEYQLNDFKTGDHRVDGDMLQFFRLTTGNRPAFAVELPPQVIEGSNPPEATPRKEDGFSGFPESRLFETFKQNICPALALINCGGLDNIPRRDLIPRPGNAIAQLEVTRNCARRFSTDLGFDPLL